MSPGVELIQKYFPDLSSKQSDQFAQLDELYSQWNERINVISRKDIENLYERHVLHSLAIAKVIQFKPGTKIMDVGTGGGFPGIPLAIMFPECDFYLVDSTGKKIKVVKEVATELELKNVRAEHQRMEKVKEKFHFVVSRAVAQLPQVMAWIRNSFLKEEFNDLPNGLIYLKGGDLTQELAPFKKRSGVFEISEMFENAFFETKKVVYISA